MKVLNFGSQNIDRIYYVDRLVRPGMTKLAHGYQVMSGGKGLNQSVSIRKAGVEVYHAGNIGRNGELLKYTLLEHGVKIDFLQKSNVDTGHAIIQLADDSDHTILVHAGSNQSNRIEDIDRTLDYFDAGDLLLLQNEINDIGYIVDRAFEKGMKIFLNPAPFNKSVYTYDLNKVDTLIVNESELLELARARRINDAVRSIMVKKLNVLLTLGLRGGTYIARDGTQHYYRAHQVESIDTSAVGDVFVGYFLAGIAQGMEMEDNLDRSSKAAALSTMRIGTVNSIPDIQSVLEYFDGKDAYEDQ